MILPIKHNFKNRGMTFVGYTEAYSVASLLEALQSAHIKHQKLIGRSKKDFEEREDIFQPKKADA